MNSYTRGFLATLVFALVFGQETTTFKVETNLVVVNVSVKDKSGKPLMNLKADDVTIFEDDKPQKIAVFELQKLDAQPLPPVPDTSGTLKERVTVPVAAAAPLPAANGPARIRFQDKRLIGLFFDFSSMQPAEQFRAQDAAVKFINTQMTSADLV